MKRYPALAVPLAPAHIGPAETARTLHSHPFGAGLEGCLDRAAHGAPERDPVLYLVGHPAGQQLRVGLGILDLHDVELDAAARQLLDP